MLPILTANNQKHPVALILCSPVQSRLKNFSDIHNEQQYCASGMAKHKAAKISPHYRHHTRQRAIISFFWTPLITSFHLKNNKRFHESYWCLCCNSKWYDQSMQCITMHATCEIPEGLTMKKTKTALVRFQWASKESVQWRMKVTLETTGWKHKIGRPKDLRIKNYSKNKHIILNKQAQKESSSHRTTHSRKQKRLSSSIEGNEKEQ